MKSNQKREANNHIGAELNYCGHCGGLWVRERGVGSLLQQLPAQGGGLAAFTQEIEQAHSAGSSTHGGGRLQTRT